MWGSIVSGAASLAGSLLGRTKDRSTQFAKHGLSWRVADAKRAGLHPLAALGANLSSGPVTHVNPLGSALSSAGQDIGAAISKKSQQPLIQAEETRRQEWHEQQMKESDARIASMGQNTNKSSMAGAAADPFSGEGLDPNGWTQGNFSGLDVKAPVVEKSLQPGIKGVTRGREFTEIEPGVYISMPTSEMAEKSEGDITTLAVNTGRELMRKFREWSTGLGITDGYARIMKGAPKLTPQMKRDGLVWRFVPHKQGFMRIKKGGKLYRQIQSRFNFGQPSWRGRVN